MKKRKESEPISSEKNLQQGLKTEGEVSAGKGIERGVENGRERKADERDANAPQTIGKRRPQKNAARKPPTPPKKNTGSAFRDFLKNPISKTRKIF